MNKSPSSKEGSVGVQGVICFYSHNDLLILLNDNNMQSSPALVMKLLEVLKIDSSPGADEVFARVL